jgi:NifU-like protein involved in Fe-S cluster formation
MMLEQALGILSGTAVLFVFLLLWFVIQDRLSPELKNPDATARVTGKCGDTMEISLQFRGQRVSQSSHWTSGCAHSYNCVCAAAQLAKGKTPDEIIEIDANRIQESIGGLPRDHLHCARLAEETLQTALDRFMLSRPES